jgi:hypothetical protein
VGDTREEKEATTQSDRHKLDFGSLLASTTDTCAVLTSGWACYKTTKSLLPMKLVTLQTLKRFYDTGNKVKSKRMLGGSAHATVIEGAAEGWYVQLLVTVVRVKAFFGYSKGKQDKLIKLAED